MKLNVGDAVVLHIEHAGRFVLHAEVEDSSKGDIIQAKVTAIFDDQGKALSEPGTLPYRVGKVDSFDRKDIVSDHS